MKFRLKGGSAATGLILSIEADKDDELAYVDAERVYRGDLNSFLPFSYDREGRSYEFSYFLGSGIALDRLLAAPLAPNVLRNALGSLLHMMQSCEQNGLSRLRVVLDPEYVYYDPALGMLRFAYVPTRSYVSEMGESGLISRICSSRMADAADQQFAVSVWDFVHRTTILTSVALEDFLVTWGLQSGETPGRKSRKGRSALGADTRASHGWDFVTALREDETRRRFERAAEKRATADAHADAAEGASASSTQPVPVLTLVRLSTATEYALVPGGYVMGRGSDCAISLPDARSVSRKHAELEVAAGTATLRDLNSTNGTFADGQRLEAGAEAHVQPSGRFTLGDEEFLLK